MHKPKFENIDRSKLLDRIEQNWVLRRKCWSEDDTVVGKEAFDEGCLLSDDWEGHPPAPTLVRKFNSVYLSEALSYTHKNSKAYFRNSSWIEGKFIKWDADRNTFVHILVYPETNHDVVVSFSGDLFGVATFEIWETV